MLRFPREKAQAFEKIDWETIRTITENINKAYAKKHKGSKRAVALLGESVFSMPKHFVSSGILPIDCAVCFGRGFPGRGIVEIFGGEATSKTAILENILAESQRVNYHTGIFPMEFSLDYMRSQRVGLDARKLMVFEEAETIEDIYELLKLSVAKIREVDAITPIVIGIDTIASTPTRSELDNEKGLAASDMGKFAQQISKLFRRLVKFLFVNDVCLVCINQTRSNLGMMYGDKETTPGGKALKFYAWVRCRMRKVKAITDASGRSIGNLCELKVVKNKIAPPFKQCTFPVYWNRGIDAALAVWEYAIDQEVLTQKGTGYRYNGRIVTKKTFPAFYSLHKDEIDKALRKATSEKKEGV